ncbi:MAG: VC0807 family protein [Bacteroidota bacterium]
MDKKKSNQLYNILFNIVIPILILNNLSKEEYFGPVYGLVIALLFPLIYGLYEMLILKQKSFISVIGFVGVLLSGLIGLFHVPPHWFAVKEAAIPLIIALVVVISTNRSWQLINKFIYTNELLDTDRIEVIISGEGLKSELNSTLKNANLLLASSFIFSAVLNYFLAKIIVQSMPGTIEFNEEVGKMTMLSFPVIAVPSIIIMIFIFRYMLSSIKRMTQLSTNEIFSKNLRSKN